MTLQPSQTGYQFIKTWEGLRLTAYTDDGGVWTIGYGTITYPDGTSVKEGDTCTLEQAIEYMEHDVAVFLDEASSHITVILNQNQIDALTSFIYNEGVPSFVKSTLLAYINEQKWDAAANQFVWQDADGNYHGWVYVNGHVDQGLVNRRKAEQRLFSSPVDNA